MSDTTDKLLTNVIDQVITAGKNTDKNVDTSNAGKEEFKKYFTDKCAEILHNTSDVKAEK